MTRSKTEAAAAMTEGLAVNAPDLLRYFERRLGTDTAPDALAEAMLAAWRRVDTMPLSEEQSRMWLFGIARHVLANTARGERRQWNLTQRFRETLKSAPRDGRPADEGIEVRDAIARLSAEQAELVRLIHWDGFSIAEAGKILGTTASTARTRYQRARADLKTTLSLPSEATWS